MKNKYLLLSYLLLCASPIIAAEGSSNMTSGVVIPGSFPHFNPQVGKTSGVAKLNFRLYARTNTLHNGSAFVPVDSTHYYFGAGRGGVLNYDIPASDESIYYDESYTYYYNNVMAAYGNKLYRKQTFNANDNVTSLTYATWRTSTGLWKDSARYLYDYLPGSSKIDVTYFQLAGAGGMWNPHDQSTLTYNGNNVVSISSLSYSATFVYDANNNIVSVEDKVSDHGSGTQYNNERKSYTYENGDVATYTLEKWDANTSAWAKNKRWEYTYNAKLLVSAIEYNWNGSSWEQYDKILYTYNNANNKTSETKQVWNGSIFVNESREIWAYNDFGLLKSITTEDWQNNTWVNKAGNTEVRYYYEYYSPTKVGETKLNTASLSMYPVPAVNTVNIKLDMGASASVAFAISDMYGRVVKQWNESNTSFYQGQVDISSLAAGNYMLTVNDGKETLSQKFTVAK